MFSYEEFEQHWQASINFLKLFERTFVSLDANGDRIIDINEWKVHNAAMGIPPDHAQSSFTAMDADGDGKITMNEFKTYYYEYFCTTENKLNSAILYGPL